MQLRSVFSLPRSFAKCDTLYNGTFLQQCTQVCVLLNNQIGLLVKWGIALKVGQPLPHRRMELDDSDDKDIDWAEDWYQLSDAGHTKVVLLPRPCVLPGCHGMYKMGWCVVHDNPNGPNVEVWTLVRLLFINHCAKENNNLSVPSARDVTSVRSGLTAPAMTLSCSRSSTPSWNCAVALG